MSASVQLRDQLCRHQTLCLEILAVIERETAALRASDCGAMTAGLPAKRKLLEHLGESVEHLRSLRQQWQQLGSEQRARYPEITALLRQVQDLIMKIIVLDRENEHALLRLGRIPARHLPSINRQRPHFVADLYRRHSVS